MKSQNPAFVLSLLAWLASLVPAAWAQTILNPSFELDHYYVSPGYASVNGGVITGWAISDATRIGLNLGGTNSPGLFADNGAIPDGTNVAFIQSSGTTNTLSTTITGLIPGVAYQVGFRANCRSGYSQPGAESSLNGGAFVPFTCYPAVGGSHPYYTNSAVFIATGGTAVLAVRNYVASPHDGTLLVDDFSIQNLLLVTTTNESGPGSLRQIVLDAAALGSAGPITFTSALSGQTILLTNGPIVLSNNITINASALANGIQIDGNGQSRIIQVNGNTTVVLNSLTLINGAVAGANGGTFENGGDGTGGGIYNAGTLTVNNSPLANNSGTGGRGAHGAGPGSGGGIYNAGTLTVNNSTLANNSGNGGGDAGGNGLGYGGSGYGGGIYNVGTLTVNNSTFANNSVTGQNGG